MVAYGFSALYAGIIGILAAFSIPGNQVFLIAASGILTGHGLVILLLTQLLRR